VRPFLAKKFRPANALCERSIGIGMADQVKADGSSHGQE
jgi:hypothetical protein